MPDDDTVQYGQAVSSSRRIVGRSRRRYGYFAATALVDFDPQTRPCRRCSRSRIRTRASPKTPRAPRRSSPPRYSWIPKFGTDRSTCAFAMCEIGEMLPGPCQAVRMPVGLAVGRHLLPGRDAAAVGQVVAQVVDQVLPNQLEPFPLPHEHLAHRDRRSTPARESGGTCRCVPAAAGLRGRTA